MRNSVGALGPRIEVRDRLDPGAQRTKGPGPRVKPEDAVNTMLTDHSS